MNPCINTELTSSVTPFPFFEKQDEDLLVNLFAVVQELGSTYNLTTFDLALAVKHLLNLEAFYDFEDIEHKTLLERFCDNNLSTASRLCCGTKIVQKLQLSHSLLNNVEEELRSFMSVNDFERSDLEDLTIVTLEELCQSENFDDTITDPTEYICCLSTNGVFYGD